MADDWDADDFEPPPPVVGKEPVKDQWDDEDVEEEKVKESWEDEDKPAAATKPKSEKKKKKEVGAKAATSVAEEDKPLDDPLAEKMRQQRLVEEADFKSAKELFGGKKEGKSLDDFIPKTEADFIEYAKLVSAKVTPFSKSYHYQTLLKYILRNVTESLSAVEAKEVGAAANVIANEKLKAEKEASGGKKKAGAKKKQIQVERTEEDDYTAQYDATDDYDFM